MLKNRTALSTLAVFLDAVDGTQLNNGTWLDCENYVSAMITVSGVASLAIVEVDVSNAETRPANNTHGVTHTALSAGANGQVTILSLPRWMKVRISTLGTGTVSALGMLRR